jgi:hypothetical protein
MRWFGVRKAKSIPDADREMFERFGAAIIGTVLYGGFSGPQTTVAQKALYGNTDTRKHAEAWLTEQYDRAERKETWSITMEAAITLFVAVELVLSILNFVPHKG